MQKSHARLLMLDKAKPPATPPISNRYGRARLTGNVLCT